MNLDLIDILKTSSLFRGMSDEQVTSATTGAHSRVSTYCKGDLVFTENDIPQRLYILIQGHIAITRTTLTGNNIVITDITDPGDLFGEVYLFMEKETYDMSAEALEETIVFSLNRSFLNDDKTGLLRANLMTIFANKAYMLSGKVRLLGCKTIREKIANYIVSRQNENGQLVGQASRENMADMLNVARPSLSRELGKMAEEGIITIEHRQLVVINQEKLEKYL